MSAARAAKGVGASTRPSEEAAHSAAMRRRSPSRSPSRSPPRAAQQDDKGPGVIDIFDVEVTQEGKEEPAGSSTWARRAVSWLPDVSRL